MRAGSQPCTRAVLEFGSPIPASCPNNVWMRSEFRDQSYSTNNALNCSQMDNMPTASHMDPTSDAEKTCTASGVSSSHAPSNWSVEVFDKAFYPGESRQEVSPDPSRVIRFFSQPATDTVCRTDESVIHHSAKRLQRLWNESVDVALSLEALCLERPRKRFCSMAVLAEESVSPTDSVFRVKHPEPASEQHGPIPVQPSASCGDSPSENNQLREPVETDMPSASNQTPHKVRSDVAEKWTCLDRWLERLDDVSGDVGDGDSTVFLSQQLARARISEVGEFSASLPVGVGASSGPPSARQSTPPAPSTDLSTRLPPPQRVESEPDIATSLQSQSQSEELGEHPLSPLTASHLAAVVTAAMAVQADRRETGRRDNPQTERAYGRGRSPSPGGPRSLSPDRSDTEGGSGRGRSAEDPFRYSKADTVPCSPNERPHAWARALSSQTNSDPPSQAATEAHLADQPIQESCPSSQVDLFDPQKSDQSQNDHELQSRCDEDVELSAHVGMCVGSGARSPAEIQPGSLSGEEPLRPPAAGGCSQPASPPCSGQSDLTGYISQLVDGVGTGLACPADQATESGPPEDLTDRNSRTAGRPSLGSVGGSMGPLSGCEATLPQVGRSHCEAALPQVGRSDCETALPQGGRSHCEAALPQVGRSHCEAALPQVGRSHCEAALPQGGRSDCEAALPQVGRSDCEAALPQAGRSGCETALSQVEFTPPDRHSPAHKRAAESGHDDGHNQASCAYFHHTILGADS